MASPTSDLSEFSAILANATKRSRWAAIVAFLGIAAVFASLLMLYILAERRADAAEHSEQVAEENASTMSDQLEAVRSAYARGDITGVGVALGVAVAKVEEIAENPTEEIAARKIDLTRRQALEIANERVAFDLPTANPRFRQSVYIQFAGNLTRAQITALNQALKESGWNAPDASGERISAADGLNEVRYSGTNEAAAKALAAAINEAGITSKQVGVHKFDIIKPQVLEAWISS